MLLWSLSAAFNMDKVGIDYGENIRLSLQVSLNLCVYSSPTLILGDIV